VTYDTDAVVVGAGLAGLVAATELVDRGRRVIVIEQEGEQSLGGQAYWSLGGLFLVDSPEQRRLGIRDSYELALQDWMGSAAFDRTEDEWPRRWAERYVAWAAGEKRAWLHAQGMRFFPIVGWAERGGYLATEHGNSVPRFHIAWGTGHGVIEPFVRRARRARNDGHMRLLFRHRARTLEISDGNVTGISGDVLQEDAVERGRSTNRHVTGSFRIRAQAIIIASGGIGGNHEMVRQYWPTRLGAPPSRMLSGVPAYVDGAMLEAAEHAGTRLINRDRMWHYVEGIRNWNPIWPMHGIRILPGPSSIWLDARGNRLPVPLFPGFDTLGTLAHLRTTGHDHSWFVLNQKIIAKEFALSGSEQNPDLTGRSWRKVIGRARGGRATDPVEAFKEHGADFIVERDVKALVHRMNALTTEPLLDPSRVEHVLVARDREIRNRFAKDMQVTAIRGARAYVGDRLIRTAPPHRILDPSAGPLIAVQLSVLTRKTLGGIETDLDGRALGHDGMPMPGLYAAGEASGFGGGGMHGYRALEGTFLGGCMFSGMVAGRAAAAAID
jgi:predicted oxidoreductase